MLTLYDLEVGDTFVCLEGIYTVMHNWGIVKGVFSSSEGILWLGTDVMKIESV